MEIANLEQNLKCIYNEFMMDNYSIQISHKNTFGRLESGNHQLLVELLVLLYLCIKT